MFADVGVIVILIVIYFIYACSDLIRNIISAFKQGYFGEESKQDPVITQEMIKQAMENRTYGDFTLTPAVVFFKERIWS